MRETDEHTRNEQLNSTFLQGGSSNLYNFLNSFKASAEYVYDHTYELSVGYFNVSGSTDALLWGPSSRVNLPYGEGIIADAAFLPFSNGGPSFYPWLNAKLSISYTS
jgi:hypothetical protein